MNAEIPQDLLLRLTLEELEKSGRQAIAGRNYARACQLLREATRRAPFRSDLRDMLSTAIEGKIEEGEGAPRSSTQSPLEAIRLAPARRPGPQRGILGRPRLPEKEGELEESEEEPAAPRAETGRRLKPGQFHRRHRRGPGSALFLGAFVGLLLASSAALAGWLYLHFSPKNAPATPEDAAKARAQQVFAQAEAYINQSNYSLAIDRLQTLPAEAERDRRLAAIFMKIGDQGFKQDPPRLQTALDAYSKAVELAPNDPEDGLALAQVYYALAGGRGGDSKAEGTQENLSRARQALQAVLDRNPEFLPACKMMVKIAGAQRDYALQQQMLRKIIQISPKESEDALNARDSLKSLGFKADN